MNALFEVQFQVYAKDDLEEESEHEESGEGGMDIGGELAALVSVAEEVAEDGEDSTEGLERDVPPGTDDLVERRCQRVRPPPGGGGYGGKVPQESFRWGR